MIHSLKCRGTFSTMGAKSFEELLNNSETVEIEVPYQEIPRGDRYITFMWNDFGLQFLAKDLKRIVEILSDEKDFS